MFAQDRPAVWSERRDLNPGPPVPQTGALTGLRYAPPPYQRTSTLMSPGAQGPPPATAAGWTSVFGSLGSATAPSFS
jgi:hypothetical protein